MPDIKIKRVYQAASEEDGYRVLVDRIWPRGLSRDVLHINSWAKDMAPSADLRIWYGHIPDRWPGFRERYLRELDANDACGEFVIAHKKYPIITLVYAAKDAEHSNAVVLQEFLIEAFNKYLQR